MPSDKEHAKLSKARTGKPFIELHKWMNEEYTNSRIQTKRHEITNIPKNIEIVREKFGDEAVKEFLYHLKEDYEYNNAYKLMRSLSIIKRTIFLPFNFFKNKQSG